MLRPGVPFLSRVVPTGAVLIQSCLVVSTETHRGQAASLVMAEEAIPSRLPLLSQMWKRLLRDPLGAPDVMSCPEEASASELHPRRASCSCGVSCSSVDCPVPVCLAPEGS